MKPLMACSTPTRCSRCRISTRCAPISLARLRHYTGTAVEHFQPFVLFTNYTRYVDEFVRWAIEQVQDPSTPYDSLACAGDVVITAETQDPTAMMSDLAWKKHQMPAAFNLAQSSRHHAGEYWRRSVERQNHLRPPRGGAPHAWLMIGHCGGLRESQSIGDYVLAHAYLRDDHVLDSVLPPDIPIPSIAEVQRALYDATKAVSGMPGEEVKQRLRTGTVVTTDDRNWELRYSASALRFNLSRAVAVDMESATIAAQGYRFRVPYGTLLCVSDKPLHGEIAARPANRFYEGAIRNICRLASAPLSCCAPRVTNCTPETTYLQRTALPLFRPMDGPDFCWQP